MPIRDNKWTYLLLLSLIWGSSFILIKKSLLGFTAMQLGGLRVVLAAVFLLLIGFRSLKTLSLQDWKWVFIAGMLSSFFPPFLFALAQTEIDSAVTSIFNSLAPLFTALVGIFLFKAVVSRRQVAGVFVGLAGTAWLLLAGSQLQPDRNYAYTVFILLSALGYAFNINIIKKHLAHLSPLAITTASFGVVLLPAILILASVGFGRDGAAPDVVRMSFLGILVLALLGTGIANIFFNVLIKVSSPVFAASVTYTIPLVAVFWGLLDNEALGWEQLLGGLVILIGVYMVNRKKAIT